MLNILERALRSNFLNQDLFYLNNVKIWPRTIKNHGTCVCFQPVILLPSVLCCDLTHVCVRTEVILYRQLQKNEHAGTAAVLACHISTWISQLWRKISPDYLSNQTHITVPQRLVATLGFVCGFTSLTTVEELDKKKALCNMRIKPSWSRASH